MNLIGTPAAAASDRPWLARFTRVAAMVIFTAMIAVISYLDGLFLIRYAGDHDWSAYLYPLIPDGLILICSIRLHEAAPKIPAWAMGGVIIGVTLTLAMNVGAGVLHNWMYALADACVPVVFFVALEVVRGAVKRDLDGDPRPAVQVAFSHDGDTAGTAETPTRDHLIIALADTGTRKEVGEFLGMSASKLQRLVTDARKAVQAVPEESAPGTFEAPPFSTVPRLPRLAELRAEMDGEPSLNGSGAGA